MAECSDSEILRTFSFLSAKCLNLLALAVLAAIMRNPVMVQELENGYEDVTTLDDDAPALPTPLSKIDPPYAFRDHSLTYRKS